MTENLAIYPGTRIYQYEDKTFKVVIHFPYTQNPIPIIHVYDKFFKKDHYGVIKDRTICMDNSDDDDLVTYFSGPLRQNIFYILEKGLTYPTHYLDLSYKISYYRVDLRKQEIISFNKGQISGRQYIQNWTVKFKQGQWFYSKARKRVPLSALEVIEIK